MVRHSSSWNRSPIRKTRRDLRALAVGAVVGVAVAFSWLIANAAERPGVRATTRAPTSVARLTNVPSHDGHYRASMMPMWERTQGHRIDWALELRTAAGAPVERATLALESMTTARHQAFDQIVRGGARRDFGMPAFSDDLTADKLR